MPEADFEKWVQGAIGGFVLLLIGSVVIAIATTWVVRKVFPPRGCPNGNGAHKDNGKVEEKLGSLVTLAEATLGEERKQTAVLEAEDGDGCKKVHNKPSIEKEIKETASISRSLWSKLKNWKPNGGGGG